MAHTKKLAALFALASLLGIALPASGAGEMSAGESDVIPPGYKASAPTGESPPSSEEHFFNALFLAACRGDLAGFLELAAPSCRARAGEYPELAAQQLKNWGRGLVSGEILSIDILQSGDMRLLCSLARWAGGERREEICAFDLGYEGGAYRLIRTEPDIFAFPAPGTEGKR